MARSTATITSQLQNDSQTVFHLMELHFDDSVYDDVFLTDNFHDVVLDTPTQSSAKTFSAAGGFLNFASVTETTKLAVNGISISLSGVDNRSTGIVSKLMRSPIINKRVVIYRSFGVASSSDNTKTYMIFDGNVKNWAVDENATEATISIEVSTHWGNFEQKNGRITNTTTQTNTTKYGSTDKFSSDRGLEYSSALLSDIQWGPTN